MHVSLIIPILLAGAGDVAHDYPVSPVDASAVTITGGFWKERIDINERATIPACVREVEKNGNVLNFAIAAGVAKGEQTGRYPFNDSDVYKTIEAMSYALQRTHDQSLDKVLDSLITLVAAAQEPDGYLYTARTNDSPWLEGWSGKERWSKLERSHELYNAGHLYEAAAAHFVATGKKSLLTVALRNAELILQTFGPDGKRMPPGHEEIEVGLVKLYRVTGDTRYVELAKFFLLERGHAEQGRHLMGTYAQDHLPVQQQQEAVGHAVRLGYLAMGLSDVSALTADTALGAAADRLWRSVVNTKMYLTGGLGATGFSEGFRGEYELPNLSGYNETCASVAGVLWNYRMFLRHADGRYVDVMERTLYNGVLPGVSREGDRFFYPNPLSSRGYMQRSEWFTCACCPPNVARLLESLPGLMYGVAEDSLYVNIFATSTATIRIRNHEVRVSQSTEYPWSGDIVLSVSPEIPVRFVLMIRIPGWAAGEPVPGDLYRYLDHDHAPVNVSVNDREVGLRSVRGYALIPGEWKKGDRVRVHLPMPVRRVLAHPAIAADRERIAIERGPIVYCIEGKDQAAGSALNVVLPDSSRFTEGKGDGELQGSVVLEGSGLVPERDGDRRERVKAIPYFANANRGPTDMTVWLARTRSAADALAEGIPLGECAFRSSGGSDEQALKGTSGDGFQWATRDTMWLECDFPGDREISVIDVRWPDNAAPRTWRVLAAVDGRWVSMYNPSGVWGTEENAWNRVVIEAIMTDRIRIEAFPGKEQRTGIAGLQIR